MTISKSAAEKIARRIVSGVCAVAATKHSKTYGFYVTQDPGLYGNDCTEVWDAHDYASALQKRREKLADIVEALVTGEQWGQETPAWYYAA